MVSKADRVVSVVSRVRNGTVSSRSRSSAVGHLQSVAAGESRSSANRWYSSAVRASTGERSNWINFRLCFFIKRRACFRERTLKWLSLDNGSVGLKRPSASGCMGSARGIGQRQAGRRPGSANCGNSVDRNDPSEAAVQQGDYAATLRRTINSLSAP